MGVPGRGAVLKSILDLSAILLTLSAVFGWLNRKAALLPHAIGLLVMGVAASLVLVPSTPSCPATAPPRRWAGCWGRSTSARS